MIRKQDIEKESAELIKAVKPLFKKLINQSPVINSKVLASKNNKQFDEEISFCDDAGLTILEIKRKILLDRPIDNSLNIKASWFDGSEILRYSNTWNADLSNEYVIKKVEYILSSIKELTKIFKKWIKKQKR